MITKENFLKALKESATGGYVCWDSPVTDDQGGETEDWRVSIDGEFDLEILLKSLNEIQHLQ